MGFLALGLVLSPNANADERSIIQFGQAVPSIENQGTQIIAEDFGKGYAIQVYAVLPPELSPMFGLYINEQHMTSGGQPRGRRISIFRAQDYGNVTPENRLAFFDFAENGVLERYMVNQPPKTWFDPEKHPIKIDSPETAKFFHKLLYEASEGSLPLKMPIIPVGRNPAPAGLLSPQILRPIYDLVNDDGITSQVTVQVVRLYDQTGTLKTLGMSMEELSVDAEETMQGIRLSLPTNIQILKPDETSKLFQISKPCSKLANELRRREGGN